MPEGEEEISRNKRRYVGVSEHLVVDFDRHPARDRLAVERGWFKLIFAYGFNCLWFEALRSGAIFWCGVRDDRGFDDFEVTGMAINVDDELDCDIAGDFALSCGFRELGFDRVDHCGNFDTAGDVVNAVFVRIRLIGRTGLWSGVIGQLLCR